MTEPTTTAETAIPAARDDEFAAFYRTELPRLAGWARQFVGDEQAALDIAQEALVRTWTRWVRVRSPRAYAYLTATNLARRQGALAARETATAPAVGWAASGTSTDAGVEGTARLSIGEALDRLPPRLRDVVVLHHVVDLPIAEVARQIRRPVGTVKRRLHEARQLLSATEER